MTSIVRALLALADLVLPTPCAGCGRAGVRWCAECRSRFGRPEVRAVAGLPPVVVLAPYAGPARETVLAYKERGRRDLAGPLAALVAEALARAAIPAATVVPAPSRRSAARARGGDHVLRIARALVRGSRARDGPVTVARALALRAGARDSVGLDAAARAANLAGHLRVRRRDLPPPGTPVLLLDDVLTTGATARASTALLRDAGCRVIAVVVLTAVGRSGGGRSGGGRSGGGRSGVADPGWPIRGRPIRGRPSRGRRTPATAGGPGVPDPGRGGTNGATTRSWPTRSDDHVKVDSAFRWVTRSGETVRQHLH